MDDRQRTRRDDDRVVDHRLKTLEKLVDAIGPSVGQVVVMQATLTHLEEWMRDERDARRAHDGELDDRIDLIVQRLDGIEADQRSGRRAIIIAVIGATATIVASLVAGYVALKAAGAAP